MTPRFLSPEQFGLVTVAVVAIRFDTCERAVQKWIGRGWLPAVPVGSGSHVRYLVPERELARFVKPIRGRRKAVDK